MRSRNGAALVALVALMSPARAQESPAPPARTIGLGAAVAEALTRHPTARVAEEEIRRAEAIVRETRASSLPTLTGNASYTRLDNARMLGTTVIAGQDQLAANLIVQVPLVAPRSWVQWAHARENVDVSRIGAAEIRRQLAVSVARTYLTVVAQHRVIEVTERARVAAKAHLEFAHARFAGGYGTRVDEVRAAQELAAVAAQVESAYAQLTRLREALGVLLGADGSIEVETDVALPDVPPPEDAFREATSQRTDIRAFTLRVTAARHVRRDDWADYMPTVAGIFEPFLQRPGTTTTPSSGWQFQLVLQLPLYDGGLRYGLARERLALENEARVNLEGGVRQAQSDVRVAYEEVKRARAALTAAREAARLAHDGLTLTTLAYREGASTNIEVIDAERSARDADTSVAVAEDADRQGRLDALVASGRFPATN